jgi:phosphoribosylformimino-5-aminoimidazole carboxamide ribotide isomerase
MILYPAIDLKSGQCVRLFKGDMNAATIYHDAPAEQALAFEKMGFTHLHLVDLDGAVQGSSINKKAILDIIDKLQIPIQLGGGIRSEQAAKTWLDAGISRIILGTVALENPALVKALARSYPGKIVVGIDAKNGQVATQGWLKTSQMSAVDLARAFEQAGVSAIIYTDIARDGTLAGANLEQTATLARATSIRVIVSGGIGALGDLEKIHQNYANLFAGVIIGRALYEHKIDPKSALELAAKTA